MSILSSIYAGLVKSDVPNIIQDISGAVAAYALRKFNCKVQRCLRIARHTVEGTTYHTCSKHTTPEVHESLKVKHAVERPKQHKLLNRKGHETCT